MTWHDVELLCPVCQEWQPSGAATTREDFESGDVFIQGKGRFVLPCGHEVMADDYEARLGPEISSPP